MNSSHYEERKAQMAGQIEGAGQVRLRKPTSNLFRSRGRVVGAGLDPGGFDQVLDIDTRQGWLDAGGMTPYDAITAASLPLGVMPSIVPQLRSITIGGAVAGIGIESSSFQYGLAHETIMEMDVLLADGTVLTCSPDNEHSDLFFGFPNSYGTLGYALRVRAKTIPVKPYVRLTHKQYREPAQFFESLGALCESGVDFIDGAIFAGNSMYLTAGKFVEVAPYTSDYSYLQIYYRSIADRDEDYLRTEDYLWRWDTDWFWCSKNLLAQNPIVRRLLGPGRLNSRFYQRVMRWNGRWRLTRGLERLSGLHREAVIQDVDVPIEHAVEFLEFFQQQIGIAPVWICPVRVLDASRRFPLFQMKPATTYVNFGFWDVLRTRKRYPVGHFNRLIEAKVSELGGIKSLYSNSCYTPEEFWREFDRPAYQALKDRYDPNGRFGDLYGKCVSAEG